MKGSNIKSKMGRFYLSACALFFAGGLLVSCEDELLTGMLRGWVAASTKSWRSVGIIKRCWNLSMTRMFRPRMQTARQSMPEPYV